MADPYEDEKGSPSQTDTGKFFPDQDDASTGKHLTFLVPDFNNAEATSGGDGSSPLNSYLRLGCAHSQAANPTRTDLGEDLAAKVKGFTDDTRNRGTEQNPAPGVPVAPAGYDPPPGSPLDYRIQESKRLHDKGGWRDHSDGNRITTTRGDKVEVIRGNYKLLVLGRQDGMNNVDGTAHAAGLDISGGNIDIDSNDVDAVGDIGYPDSSATNTSRDQGGLSMSWEWVQDTGPTASGTPGDGVWRWHVTNTQGSEIAANNPAIVSNTWAYTIDTFVGSAARPVHEMTSATYVEDQTVNTYVTHTQNVTTTAASSATTTNATGSVDVNVSSGEYTQSISAGSITNKNTSTGTITTSNYGPAIVYTDVGAARVEVDLAMLMMELKLAVAVFEIKSITHHDIHLGAHFDMHLGLHTDVCVGNSTQIIVGTQFEGLVGGPHLQLSTGPEIKVLPTTEIATAMFHVL